MYVGMWVGVCMCGVYVWGCVYVGRYVGGGEVCWGLWGDLCGCGVCVMWLGVSVVVWAWVYGGCVEGDGCVCV